MKWTWLQLCHKSAERQNRFSKHFQLCLLAVLLTAAAACQSWEPAGRNVVWPPPKAFDTCKSEWMHVQFIAPLGMFLVTASALWRHPLIFSYFRRTLAIDVEGENTGICFVFLLDLCMITVDANNMHVCVCERESATDEKSDSSFIHPAPTSLVTQWTFGVAYIKSIAFFLWPFGKRNLSDI